MWAGVPFVSTKVAMDCGGALLMLMRTSDAVDALVFAGSARKPRETTNTVPTKNTAAAIFKCRTIHTMVWLPGSARS